MSIQHKIKTVHYQLLKNSIANPTKTWTDDELVDAVRGLYDELIDEAEDVSTLETSDLPTVLFAGTDNETTIEWSEDKTSIIVRKGNASTPIDDLTDDTEANVYDTSKFLETNGDLFTVKQTGDYFELSY